MDTAQIQMIKKEFNQSIVVGIPKGLSILSKYLPETSLGHHHLLSFKAHFNTIEDEKHKGYITSQEYFAAISRLRGSLLDFVSSLKIEHFHPYHILKDQSTPEKQNQIIQLKNHPSGILDSSLSASIPLNPEKLQYKDYLRNNVLPYISRDEYATNHQLEKDQDFHTETSILSRLLNNNRYQGCIIYGEGGIGKTRLMLELGKRCQHLDWEVYLIRKNAQNLDALQTLLNPEKKAVLIIDYLEESKSFSRYFQRNLRFLSPMPVKVIANCRNTFAETSHLFDNDLYFDIALDRENPHELDYEKYVIQQILKDVELPEDNNIDFFTIKPSFAVFLKFIHDSKRLELADFLYLKEFKGWVKRRMQLTLGIEESENLPREIIHIMACLPISAANRNKIEKNFPQTIEKLMADGWIEETFFKDPSAEKGEDIGSIHDTVVDELLLNHLDHLRKDVFKNRLIQSLEFAAKYQLTDSWMRSLERIAPFIKEKRKQQIQKIIQKKLDLFKEDVHALAINSLFDEITRLELFLEHPDFFGNYIKSDQFAKPMSFLLNRLSSQDITEKEKKKVAHLYQIWHKANPDYVQTKKKKIVSRILSTAIRFFGPDSQKQELAEYQKLNFIPDQANYVLLAWIESGGDLTSIQAYLKRYLEPRATAPDNSYIFNAWLDRGDDHQIIHPFFIKFLHQNPINQNAQKLLEAWLNSGGSAEAIAPFTDNYLSQYVTNDKARFLIESWIKAGGEASLILPYLSTYLDHHTEQIQNRWMLQLWIKNGYSFDHISSAIISFLVTFRDHPDTGSLLFEWINKPLIAEQAKPFIIQYLDIHLGHPKTGLILNAAIRNLKDYTFLLEKAEQFIQTFPSGKWSMSIVQNLMHRDSSRPIPEVFFAKWYEETGHKVQAFNQYRKWLKQPELLHYARPVLQRWLLEHGAKKEGNTLLQLLIKKEEKLSSLQSFMEQWLEQFGTTLEANFIYQKWFERIGAFEVIETPLLKWLEIHTTTQKANFVMEIWIKKTKSMEAIAPNLITWLQKYGKNEEAKGTYICILRHLGMPDEIRPFLNRWEQLNGPIQG